MDIRKLRAHEGLGNDLATTVYQLWKDGSSITDAARDGAIEVAITRYRDKIEAALRRAGLDIQDGEELNLETITRLISEKTGLDLTDLTLESIGAALEKRIAAELSAQLGITVNSVMNAESLKAELVASAVHAVKSGKANALIGSVKMGQIRAAATWQKAGIVDEAEQNRIMSAKYQKKYRRTHRQVWDKITSA